MSLQNFIKYCDAHGQDFNHLSTNVPHLAAHLKFLRQIYSDPPRYGFGKVENKWIEVACIDEEGSEIARPDIIFIDRNDEVYLIEVKSGERGRKGSTPQLMKAYDFIQRQFDIYLQLWEVRHSSVKSFHRHRVIIPIKNLLNSSSLYRK